MQVIQLRRLNLRSLPNNAPTTGEYSGESRGHPVVYWPGWVTNEARYSTQPDIQPLPVSPIHFQTFPFIQIQLSNGWQQTNYGKKAAYDDYLRMLYSSNSSPGAPPPMPGQRLQAQGQPIPSRVQLQNQIAKNAPSDTGGQLGTGILAPGVDLSARRFYG